MAISSTIKATTGGSFRKITVPTSVDLATLNTRLSSRFPDISANPTIFYVDSDNDVIEISSTEELQDAIQSLEGAALKIGVGVITDEKVALLLKSGASVNASLVGGDPVLDFSPFNGASGASTPKPTKSAVPSEEVKVFNTDKKSPEKKTPSVAETTKVTPEAVKTDENAPPTYESQAPGASAEKGKAKEAEPTTEASSSKSKTTEKNTEEDAKKENFGRVKEAFEEIIETIQKMTEEHPELFDQANTLISRIMEDLPIEEHLSNLFFGEGFPGFRGFNPMGMGGMGGMGGLPWGRGFRSGGCRPRAGGCRRGGPFRGPASLYFGVPLNADHNQAEKKEIAEEELERKITEVQAIVGFTENDNEVKDLLKRYGGNVERVVELTMRKRAGGAAKEESN